MHTYIYIYIYIRHRAVPSTLRRVLGFSSGEAFLLRSRFKGKVSDLSGVNQFWVRYVALRRVRRWPSEPLLDKPKVIKNPFIWTPGRCDKIASKTCPYDGPVSSVPQGGPRPPQDPPRPPQAHSPAPFSTSSVLPWASR